MQSNDAKADAHVLSPSIDNPKDASKGISTDGASIRANGRLDDAAPPSPVTPLPSNSNGAWQRPLAKADDSSGASTSDRNQHATRIRWAVNIKQWNPWDDEWLFLLDMLPEEDQKEVRLYFPEQVECSLSV